VSRPKRPRFHPAAAHNEGLRIPTAYADFEEVPVRHVSPLLTVTGTRVGFWRGWPYVESADGRGRVYSRDGLLFDLVSKHDRRRGATGDEAVAFLRRT
jgi:hypothetical protein